ncbi:MAG: shikimate kinase [Bacteroidales bacterium]|nr:shikimate kinase [Bacteroidales bacterium]
MERIVIVGFPGAGKSSVGRRLAARLNWNFVDTDTYFESKYHISIPDFFSKYGEDFFRISEATVLKEVLKLSHVVISTGGGMPCFFENMDLIVSSSCAVYLKLSPKSLATRLAVSHKVRPLVTGNGLEEITEYVEKTLVEREVFYSRAQITVKGESLVLDDLLALLRDSA